MHPNIDAAAIVGLKFSWCLPDDLSALALEARLVDRFAIDAILRAPLSVVAES